MNEVAEKPDAISRQKIVDFENAVKGLPQVEFEIKHHFAKGVYAREMMIPKGGVLVGRVHRQSQINICPKGDISIATESGVVRIHAPFTIVSPAGTKRAGFAHEDTIWITILGTEETEPDIIKEKLTTETFEELLEGER